MSLEIPTFRTRRGYAQALVEAAEPFAGADSALSVFRVAKFDLIPCNPAARVFLLEMNRLQPHPGLLGLTDFSSRADALP